MEMPTHNTLRIINIILLIIIIIGIGLLLLQRLWVPELTNYILRGQGTESVQEREYQVNIPPQKSTQTETARLEKNEVAPYANSSLTKVPDTIFKNTAVTSLNLSHNNLSGSLPAEVRHLSHLRTLDLSYNNFTGVPAEIGQLSELEELNLSHNPITGLPLELGNLKNLKILDLRATNYSKIDLENIRKNLPPETDIKI